ncbi:hypothetical protein BN871_CO_00120 [Paenibacillus sp. P22]|nr:hypothetical protein BN871_CO_00120 [Paenibacillus sp. P22]
MLSRQRPSVASPFLTIITNANRFSMPFHSSLYKNKRTLDEIQGPRVMRLDKERLTEQGQYALRSRVGLSQHRLRSLKEDVVLRESNHFLRHVRIADAGLGSRQVFRRRAQVVGRVFQTVLNRTQLAAFRCYCGDSIVDVRQRGSGSQCSKAGRHNGGNGNQRAFVIRNDAGADSDALAVERRVRQDVADLGRQSRHFLANVSRVGGLVRAVVFLDLQFLHARQHGGNFVQSALSRLHEGDAVLRIALSLLEAADLAAHVLGNGKAGSVVGSAVDAQAGGEFLHVFAGSRLVQAHVAVRVDCGNIVVDNHDSFPP